jgi:hypothetical protein
MHRDGVDYVLILLVDRANVRGGTTTIADLKKRPLASFVLALPLDAAWVVDARVYHGVTPIKPLDKTASAHRDALVVTFRKAGWEAESHSTAPCPRRRGT